MTLKKFLLSITGLTLLSLIIFLIIAFSIDPKQSNWAGFFLFYFSLFLFLSGILAIFGFTLRKKIVKNNFDFYLIKTSFRQSFLFSFLIIATLFMIAERLFSWLNIIILIIILTIIEYILINEKK